MEICRKDADGNEIDDRKIDSAPEEVVIDTVAKWAAIPIPPSEEPTIVNIKAFCQKIHQMMQLYIL